MRRRKIDFSMTDFLWAVYLALCAFMHARLPIQQASTFDVIHLYDTQMLYMYVYMLWICMSKLRSVIQVLIPLPFFANHDLENSVGSIFHP